MNERLQKVRNLPLHQYLGVYRIESDQGNGSLAFEVGNNVINPAGMLHGGVIYMLCDVCAYAGLLSVLDADREAVTHDIHVSVMRAAEHGQVVEMTSRLVKKGKTLCFIDVTAAVSGKPIATARVTKSIIQIG